MISSESSIMDLFRQFTETEIRPQSKSWDEGEHFPLDTFKKLHELGWLQSPVPKKYGGMEISTVDLLLVSRILGTASAGFFVSFLANILGFTPVIIYANPDLKKRLCENYLKEFSLWSFCMTEPDAGTDVASIQTRAINTPGGYRINGQKCFITNANFSSHLTVFANLEGAGVTAFYVPADAPGVRRGSPLKKMGLRCSNTSEIYFEDVFVPTEHLLAEPGKGLKILYHAIQRSKTLISGAVVGICDRAGELAVKHLFERVHYGEPLLKKPAIQGHLAQLYTEAEASWLLALAAATRWDTGNFAVKEASMAKLFSTHTAMKFVSEAVELFGGYGICQEYEIERLYRDVKAFEIVEGATLVQQTLIARSLFGHLFVEKGKDRRAA